MEKIIMINLIIAIIFFLCYCYQFLYVVVSFFQEDKPHQHEESHNFAVLIAARNESSVIGHLINSLQTQTYNQDQLKIFVIADNCTDNTAQIARDMGAIVYERFDQDKIGKGYAMDYLLNRMEEDYDPFDGYFIFDADNVLDVHYIEEMNKTFSDGYDIITSYRNSKNQFLKRHNLFQVTYDHGLDTLIPIRTIMHIPPKSNYLHSFFFSRRIFEKHGGWKFFLLTEDIQFTVENVISGEKIGYCRNAIIYDEQPIKFRQSFRQRMRWAKGFFQVFRQYGGDLLKGTARRNPSCYDMMMVIMPAIFLTLFCLLMNITAIMVGDFSTNEVHLFIYSLQKMLVNIYLTLVTIGTITTVTQWNQIHNNCIWV